MLDHPLRHLEVSLSTHRVSHRGVQTPAAAHCHQHRIQVVMCHYSFNSCNDISATFRAMFPDSCIAKTFTCGATKCTYLSCFGLAPYFHEQLVDMVRSTACYSISFDDCMNNTGTAIPTRWLYDTLGLSF